MNYLVSLGVVEIGDRASYEAHLARVADVNSPVTRVDRYDPFFSAGGVQVPDEHKPLEDLHVSLARALEQKGSEEALETVTAVQADVIKAVLPHLIILETVYRLNHQNKGKKIRKCFH